MTTATHVPALNATNLHTSVFILMGIPGVENEHIWISIPFSIMYIVAVVGNSGILFIIKTDASLHNPMFFFFSMLAGTDLVITNTTLPKALGIFWFNFREIYLNSCVIQMYIAHVFTSFESGVLVLMALDRYIAICNPLRYALILTNQRTAIMGLVIFFRSALLYAPYPYLVKRLPYCTSNIIAHTYCEHMSVAKLACSDITVNIIYGLTVTLFNGVCDFSFIVFSYVMILTAVSHLSTQTERWKTISTCTSHVCVMTVFYLPIVYTLFIQRFTHDAVSYIHIIVANIHFLVPPMVNPLVYGVKTRQIRVRVLNMIHCGRLFSPQYV